MGDKTMTKTYVLAAILAATLSGSALAQSYNPEFGTANVTAEVQAPVADQALQAHAEAIDNHRHVVRPAFTDNERALFNRIRPY
ncbi:hypothetical protein DW352_19645 [Pseudolabrys taiwanensis]|uniref:DUF4148 domain-containing protein n=2 Tax=Pseudolabrys taiwanensis TaxID=331696 RepID=A0A346A043_9HYPH|nr:hypothetical protein DW352_19645 [Pseudolabrys taiwanensis]